MFRNRPRFKGILTLLVLGIALFLLNFFQETRISGRKKSTNILSFTKFIKTVKADIPGGGNESGDGCSTDSSESGSEGGGGGGGGGGE